MFNTKDTGEPIARVANYYLYKDDIKDLVPDGSSAQDSAFVVSQFINRWALNQLLMDGAELNLSVEKQAEFDRMVTQYKSDLYSKAYLERLVKKNIDSVVNNEEALDIYTKNRESFKLNEELLKFRYVAIPENAINLDEIEERFKRFNFEDRRYLDSISVQFKSYSLNDSIWIKLSQIYSVVPVFKRVAKNKLLNNSNFLQVKDSINLYLVQINEVLQTNDYAPLEYVKPTINQVVINKRKLDLITKLENDIIKDAIENDKFELYKD